MSLNFLTISSQHMKHFNPFVLSNWGSHPSHQNICTLSRSKLPKLDFASTQMAVNMTWKYCFGFTWQNWKLSLQNYPEFVENFVLNLFLMKVTKNIEKIAISVSVRKNVISFNSVSHTERWLGRSWSLHTRRRGMLVDFLAHFNHC